MNQINFNAKSNQFSNSEEHIKGKLLGFGTHNEPSSNYGDKMKFDIYIDLDGLIQVSFTLYSWQCLFLLNKLQDCEINNDFIISLVTKEDNTNILVKCGDTWQKNKYSWDKFKIPPQGDKTGRRNEVIDGLILKLPKYKAPENNDLPF